MELGFDYLPIVWRVLNTETSNGRRTQAVDPRFGEVELVQFVPHNSKNEHDAG